ncbi:MAG: RNA methyltransferase, partial [Candidatus Omnitrophica bacterium]|nr:RNA methyltransferase [Candidatus Omnitrophota bacterium]
FKDVKTPEVTLYQAMPKHGKMDFIIEKAVELGVHAIVPLVTERTVTSIVRDRAHIKRERWIRLSKAASKQCGRVKLPLISGVTEFNDALVESKKKDLVIFAALDKDAEPLPEILKESKAKSIAVFVGPEGDFSQAEITMAKNKDFRICSLGSLVLRVETAALYILSCLNYEYNS